MTTTLRGELGGSLAARVAALLRGQPSPFVTQSQLMGLVKTDRSDIERQVRQAEWMMRHPQRGMSALVLGVATALPSAITVRKDHGLAGMVALGSSRTVNCRAA